MIISMFLQQFLWASSTSALSSPSPLSLAHPSQLLPLLNPLLLYSVPIKQTNKTQKIQAIFTICQRN